MNGKSLTNSSVVMEGTSTLKANITVAGESVAVKSLTMGANTSFGALVTSASTFDQVNVTNAANLAGTFKLTLASGYVPDLGASFSIINYGSRPASSAPIKDCAWRRSRAPCRFTASTGLSLTSTIASGASQALQVVPSGGLNLTTGSFLTTALTTDELTTGILRKATIIGGVASQSTALTMSLTVSSTGFEPSPDFNSTTLQLHGTGIGQVRAATGLRRSLGSPPASTKANSPRLVRHQRPVRECRHGQHRPAPAKPMPHAFRRRLDAATHFHLGYYGVDTVNNRMWAVLGHNSTYGFTQVEGGGDRARTRHPGLSWRPGRPRLHRRRSSKPRPAKRLNFAKHPHR